MRSVSLGVNCLVPSSLKTSIEGVLAVKDISPSPTPLKTSKTKKASIQAADENSEKLMRVRVRALEIPPIKDCLVIGTDAAIGGEAMTRTLRLMTNEKFERILLRDDVVQEIIARTAIVRKVGHERLVKFVRERIKPVMGESELLLLDIEVELVIEHLL